MLLNKPLVALHHLLQLEKSLKVANLVAHINTKVQVFERLIQCAQISIVDVQTEPHMSTSLKPLKVVTISYLHHPLDWLNVCQ